ALLAALLTTPHSSYISPPPPYTRLCLTHTPSPETYTLSLHDALPISELSSMVGGWAKPISAATRTRRGSRAIGWCDCPRATARATRWRSVPPASPPCWR